MFSGSLRGFFGGMGIGIRKKLAFFLPNHVVTAFLSRSVEIESYSSCKPSFPLPQLQPPLGTIPPPSRLVQFFSGPIISRLNQIIIQRNLHWRGGGGRGRRVFYDSHFQWIKYWPGQISIFWGNRGGEGGGCGGLDLSRGGEDAIESRGARIAKEIYIIEAFSTFFFGLWRILCLDFWT